MGGREWIEWGLDGKHDNQSFPGSVGAHLFNIGFNEQEII
jgi:hypothetical protein